MSLGTITTYSHHFVVSRVSARLRAAINEMSRSLIIWKTEYQGYGRPYKKVPDKTFAAANNLRNEFRYHINHLETFKRILTRYQIIDELIEWRTAEIPEPAKMTLVMNPNKPPLPHQVGPIEYISSPTSPRSKLLVLQPGKGKTYSAMAGASIIGDRVVATLRPKYIDQWLRDFKENCVIDPKRICVIQGSKKGKTANKGFKDLVNLVLMAEQGPLPYDVIVISVEVLRRYFDLYEEHGTELESVTGCSVHPSLFFEHIGAGTRIIDEVHENFWFNFKLDLYTHIKNSISLSATPHNDNPFIQDLINIAYPPKDRYDTGEIDKYANVYSLLYSVRRPTDFNTKQRGMGSYSHVEFEKSIMKRKNTLNQYFKMVHDSMIFTYDLEYQPGNRCLVYFATVEMCGLFRDYVQKKYPDRKVIRFVSGDSYEDLQTADISVSTIGSAGTGKDIPMLTAVILTVAVNSSPSNIQGFGRLRKLPGGRRMDFVYFVGTDFIKHLDYHDRKKEILSTRALIMENRYYGTMI